MSVFVEVVRFVAALPAQQHPPPAVVSERCRPPLRARRGAGNVLVWRCPTQGASQPCDCASGHGAQVLLPPLAQQIVQQQRVDVSREGEAALMGLSLGLGVQVMALEAKQYRRLSGELLLFSTHLQNIRLFIVTCHC